MDVHFILECEEEIIVEAIVESVESCPSALEGLEGKKRKIYKIKP